MLLDLLGAPGPRVPSYFDDTHWAYACLAGIERRMRGLGVLETTTTTTGESASRPFLPDTATGAFRGGYVADDHVPFLQRGVNVLHVIPMPFPAVWHTLDDDAAHLHLPTVRDWARILTGFVAEWMDLDAHMLGGRLGVEKEDEGGGGDGRRAEGSEQHKGRERMEL